MSKHQIKPVEGLAIVQENGMVFSTFRSFAEESGYLDAYIPSSNLYNGQYVTLLAKGRHSDDSKYGYLYVVENGNKDKFIIEESGLDILKEIDILALSNEVSTRTLELVKEPEISGKYNIERVNCLATVNKTNYVYPTLTDFAKESGFMDANYDDKYNPKIEPRTGEKVRVILQGDHPSINTKVCVVENEFGKRFIIDKVALEFEECNLSQKKEDEDMYDLWINDEFHGECSEEYIKKVKLSKAVLSYEFVEDEERFCINLDLRAVLDSMREI